MPLYYPSFTKKRVDSEATGLVSDQSTRFERVGGDHGDVGRSSSNSSFAQPVKPLPADFLSVGGSRVNEVEPISGEIGRRLKNANSGPRNHRQVGLLDDLQRWFGLIDSVGPASRQRRAGIEYNAGAVCDDFAGGEI